MATVAVTDGIRNVRRPPAIRAASRIAINRHAHNRAMRTSAVSATDGVNISRANCGIPRIPWISTATATRATGIAKTNADRRRSRYHWPRPGQRNERKAASEGERARAAPGATSAVKADRCYHLPPDPSSPDSSGVGVPSRSALHHHEAAVHGQDLAGDERGLVG